jgi:LacI family transcriptional regulator
VAESTVSRALCDSPLISQAVRDRVKAAARSLGYVPSRLAARFAARRTYHLGFVIRSYKAFPPFSRPYFPTLLDGAVLGAEECGYHVTIILDRRHEGVDELVRHVSGHEVDGLLFTVTPADDDRVAAMLKSGAPFVLINNYLKGVSSVDNRPEPGMRKALEHLVELGHRHIGYVTGDLSYRNATDRLATFKRLAAELGCTTAVEFGNFSRASGVVGAGRLLQSSSPPTAIITAADRAALGVLDYCRQHRIRVPEDVSVVGYDNLDPARDVMPPLTTVDNPITATGREAARLLVDIIEKRVTKPEARWLDTGFVVRQSTGPCPHKEGGYS